MGPHERDINPLEREWAALTNYTEREKMNSCYECGTKAELNNTSRCLSCVTRKNNDNEKENSALRQQIHVMYRYITALSYAPVDLEGVLALYRTQGYKSYDEAYKTLDRLNRATGAFHNYLETHNCVLSEE